MIVIYEKDDSRDIVTIAESEIAVVLDGDHFTILKHRPLGYCGRYHLGEFHNKVLRYATNAYKTGKE